MKIKIKIFFAILVIFNISSCIRVGSGEDCSRITASFERENCYERQQAFKDELREKQKIEERKKSKLNFERKADKTLVEEPH